jgi:hypothetical protein
MVKRTRNEAESRARRRTLERMRQLLAAGAAVGGLGLAGGCMDGDSLPPPLECARHPTSKGLQACGIVNPCVGHTAVWAPLDEELIIYAQLWIDAGMYPEVTLEFAGDPQLLGATLIDVSREPGSMTFRCRPDAGQRSVDVTVPLACDSLAEEIRFRFDLSGTPEQAQLIPIDPLD